MLKPSIALPDDAAGRLRFLAVSMCDELIAISSPGVGPEAINTALDRLHDLSEEMWRLTIDVHAPHQ